METREIKLRKNKKVLAEGYKTIHYNLSTKGDSDFRYGDKDENIIGKAFTVDENIKECRWGLHFCKDPANVFNFYEPLGYNRYFKIQAFDEVIDTDDGLKSVARTIKFTKEYDIMEYINIIKKYDRAEVNNSDAVNWSDAVNRSNAVRNCEAVSKCIFCADIDSFKFGLFNKKITEERYEEVLNKIKEFDYKPNFTNFYELKGNKEWYIIAFPELMNVDNKTAWSKMPKEMKEYLESLPEYDEEVFNRVTGE